MSAYRKRAIPLAVRREVAVRAGGSYGRRVTVTCHYCPTQGEVSWLSAAYWPNFVDLELDHVVPEFHGGVSTADNIVLACQRCNRRKGAQHTDSVSRSVNDSMSGSVSQVVQVS